MGATSKSSCQVIFDGLGFVIRVELALLSRVRAWNNELIMRVIVSLGQILMYSLYCGQLSNLQLMILTV